MFHISGKESLASFHHIIEEQYIQKPYKKVNQYLFLKKIGQGAISRVYLAKTLDTDQYFAIKDFPVKADVLRNEVGFLENLSNPHIISMVETIHTEEKSYLVLKWADCGSLDTNNFSQSDIASVYKQILDGYLYLQTHGLAHRDIKPANILIFSDGTAKLTDFGIGHHFESADEIIGTPAYQAPEIVSDEFEINPLKEDVWSFGVSIYESIFGHLPFEGENLFEVAFQANTRELEIDDDIDPNIKEVLRKTLQPNPIERISMTDLVELPWIKNAPNLIQAKLTPRTPPPLDQSREIIEIHAEIGF